MSGSVIVTGASSGLGLVASARLAEAGWHVVLACRDPRRGEAAAMRVRAEVPGASVEVVELDLASLGSVREGARVIVDGASGRPPLRALVCNAGIQIVDGVKRSADGHEMTFATNHLGHFLLTTLLLAHIEDDGRVLIVSSGTHYGPPRSMGFPGPRWSTARTLADPEAPGIDVSPKGGRIRYSTSKLANIYMTYELARRTSRVRVNAFDPGLMPETRLDRDYPKRFQGLYDRLTPVLLRFVKDARSVAESGADVAWHVTAPELADVSGAYFSGRRRRDSSKESLDRARAAELWQVSEELVKS